MKKKRILLIIPAASYRTRAFLHAGMQIGVDITVASEETSTLEERNPQGLLTLDLQKQEKAVKKAIEFSSRHPITAVIGVDDQSVVLAAVISSALSLTSNSVESVSITRNKWLMREGFRRGCIYQPRYLKVSTGQNPDILARKISEGSFGVTFPCVLKPLTLSASRGVIRANNEVEFVAAFERVRAILENQQVLLAREGGKLRSILVEEFIHGNEVALEGLLSKGKLQVLAIFDKPDPLEGPFFEETIYVTPPRLPERTQKEIAELVQRAVEVLDLGEGPIHAELRINSSGLWMIEIAARSIGGYCSKALRFEVKAEAERVISLEELILCNALEIEVGSFHRESRSSGVMMIPIQRGGILEEVKGLPQAMQVTSIEDVLISTHVGERLVPLPEGGKYLGFIFSRAETPEMVEAALREAHRRLDFAIRQEELVSADKSTA